MKPVRFKRKFKAKSAIKREIYTTVCKEGTKKIESSPR